MEQPIRLTLLSAIVFHQCGSLFNSNLNKLCETGPEDIDLQRLADALRYKGTSRSVLEPFSQKRQANISQL